MALSIFLSFCATLWLTLLYLAIGHGVFFILRLGQKRELLFILTRFAIGFALIGNTVMILGFVGAASPRELIVMLITFTILSCVFIPHSLKDIIFVIKKAYNFLRCTPLLQSVLLLLLIFGYGIRGLLPPTCFDTLIYHLAIPKLYLTNAGFYNIYFNPHSDIPMLTQMHYLIGLALGNEIICRSLSFVIAVWTLAVIAVLCRVYFGTYSILPQTLLIFLTSTVVIANMSTCYVDIAQALWTVLSLLLLEMYFRNSKPKVLLLLCAICCGMAVQSKSFGVLAIAVVVCRWIFERKSKIFSMQGITELFVLFVIPLLMVAPWWIKSLIYNNSILSISKGNPLTFSNIVGNTTSRIFSKVFDFIIRIITVPWSMCLFARYHHMETLNPLFIIVVPFLLLIKIPSDVKKLFIGIISYQLCIMGMETLFSPEGISIRYSMSSVVMGMPLIAWTITRLQSYRRIQLFCKTAVVCFICLGSILFFKRYHKDWIAFFTLKSRDAYLESVLPDYPAIRFINSLNDGKKVMPTYNFSNYYIDIPYIAAYRSYNTEEEVLQDFKEKNIGYIFANNVLDTAENKYAFSMLTTKETIYHRNGIYVFKIK